VKNNTVYQQRLFQIAAFFNISVGMVILFAHQWLFNLINIEITNNHAYLAMTQVVGVAIATFGIGYYLVSQSVHDNKGVILLGIVSKLAVLIIFTIAYFKNPTMLPFFIAGLGEFGFIALFIKELKTMSLQTIN